MINPDNPEQLEGWIHNMLINGRISEKIYGDIEPPEMLDSEDFVDEYEVNMDGEVLSVSANMGETRYNFNNAERDKEGALKLFSGVFHNMYDQTFFPFREYDIDVENVRLNVVGEKGKLVHEMTPNELLEIDEQAKINTEFRSRGDSPMETGKEALGEEAEMYEERANLYLEHLIDNGEYEPLN